MRGFTIHRFVAFAFFGCCLLLIYQVVFMARTSANRDWNHLHHSKFTLPSLQRVVMQKVNEERLEESLPELEEPGSLLTDPEFPEFFTSKSVSYASQLRNPAAVLADVKCDSQYIQLSGYAGVFGFASDVANLDSRADERRNSKKDSKKDSTKDSTKESTKSKASGTLVLKEKEVEVVLYSREQSIAEVVDAAVAKGRQAVVYVVPANWEPNYGLKIYDIPVIPVQDLPRSFHKLTLHLEDLDPSSWSIKEWRVHGYSPEVILVGDSRASVNSTAAFLEVAKVFQVITKLGWKPLRSIRFVSFPHYTAQQWAAREKSWLKRRGIAYIDCGPRPIEGNPDYAYVASSPSLKNLSSWVADQIVDGGIAPHINVTDVYGSILGANTFLFDLQLPSVGVTFDSITSQARYIALMLATLAQEPILPLHIEEYAPFIVGSSKFESEASFFDGRIEKLRDAFSREYPWYQGGEKYRAIAQRKQANLIMSLLERNFANATGNHIIFSSDPAGTHTSVSRNRTQIDTVIDKLIADLSGFP